MRGFFRNLGGIESPETPAAPPKPVRDLDARELAHVIQEGVFQGVLKAVAVYALISLFIWFLVAVFGGAHRFD